MVRQKSIGWKNLPKGKENQRTQEQLTDKGPGWKRERSETTLSSAKCLFLPLSCSPVPMEVNSRLRVKRLICEWLDSGSMVWGLVAPLA